MNNNLRAGTIRTEEKKGIELGLGRGKWDMGSSKDYSSKKTLIIGRIDEGRPNEC